MEFIKDFIDVILHLDTHLVELVSRYGTFSYAILFAIIFCETGLVVTPFLPGDSLLFAIGALSAKGALDVYTAAFLHQQKGGGVDVERAFGRQGADGEEQRIARQERRHYQARFAEDDREKNGVRECPVTRDQFNEVCVEMKNYVNEVLDKFHAYSCLLLWVDCEIKHRRILATNEHK